MLLRIEDLHTHFLTGGDVLRAVDGVWLSIDREQTVALVGESGCGKSLTALSVLRLVPPPGRIVAGRILFDGIDLLSLPEPAIRALRGNRIAMIFQEPMSGLNPVLPVGQQIVEAIRGHRRTSLRAARQRAVALLARVGVSDAPRRVRSYPHELSGGMCQRAMIAMALACEPTLLIADEPTTALDVTIQAQILELLADLQAQHAMSILFITHDLALVAQFAERVNVMYAGKIVEQAGVAQLFRAPRHPYTRALLRSVPRLSTRGKAGPAAADVRKAALPVIPGQVPGAGQRPEGCAFHPRCEVGYQDPVCRVHDPPLCAVDEHHTCACWQAAGYPLPAPGS